MRTMMSPMSEATTWNGLRLHMETCLQERTKKRKDEHWEDE